MGTRYGYHASHEQFSPADLLTWVKDAEQAGFSSAMCSDHFFPWLPEQSDGVAHAYPWLGAAMQATTFPMGVVSAPGQRYHPAILAQAAATLQQMFPGRFWMAIGSGEYMNEHVTGEPWPDKKQREQRLLECAEVMRALWRGETVDHEGLVRVRDARLFGKMRCGTPLLGAAVTKQTARWVGTWADGLITVNAPLARLREVVESFRETGGNKPVYLQYHLSWAPSRDEAFAQAHDQWRNAAVPTPLAWDLASPEEIADAATSQRPSDLTETIAISESLAWHTQQLAEYAHIGFKEILLHQTGRNQAEFIEAFGEQVLSKLQ